MSVPVPNPVGPFLPGERNVPKTSRIFVNRNLRMDRIRALGFDMDHTLALYNRETFEQLTFDLAVRNLVEWKEYPEEVQTLRYDPEFIIRGLVVDKRYGNLLKMDFHNYITRVYHGTKELPKELRRRYYRSSRVNLRSDRYQSFDTLFSMPEGSLFAALVDLKEDQPKGPLQGVQVAQIFDDVRDCVDRIHRDGSLKSVIMKDLARYFIVDENLRPTLERFRALGKKLFLVTNSEHEYTEAVMKFVLNGNGEDWRELFDLVVVESRKPGFFTKDEKAERIEIDGHKHIYRGGKASFVEKQLGAKGDQVIYFGDHTYGDILRSKKTVGWRTAMIVHELEHEVQVNDAQAYVRGEHDDLVSRWKDVSRDRDQVELLLSTMRRFCTNGAGPRIPPWAGEYTRKELEEFREAGSDQRDQRIKELEGMLSGLEFLVGNTIARTKELEHQMQREFNPYWGHLFREGNELSRFGRQVREFACIYSSRVSNFKRYPVNYYFIAPEERMAHEV